MKQLITILFILFSINTQAQLFKDIFKYSTLYSSYTETSPLFIDDQYFVTQAGDLVNVTPEQSNDFMMSFDCVK